MDNLYFDITEKFNYPDFYNTMKFNFLWHDNIFINYFRNDSPVKSFIKTNSELDGLSRSDISYMEDVVLNANVASGGEINKILYDFHNIERIGYPRWKNGDDTMYHYPDPENWRQYLHNCILRKIEHDKGERILTDRYEIIMAEGTARSAVNAIEAWSILNKKINCSLMCDYNIKYSIEKYIELHIINGYKEKDKNLLFKLSLPDVSLLDWDELIQIRKGGEFSYIKKRIMELYQLHEDATLVSELFRNEIMRVSKKIVYEKRPSITKILFKSIVTNIPSPFSSLLSAALGYKDFIDGVNDLSNNRWLYAYLELENKVNRN